MGTVFETLDADEHAYFKSNKAAVALLGAITPAEKAQSVPYVKLWSVNADGSPTHADSNGDPSQPISLLLVQPPSFGSAVAGRFFTERPPVSLDRVTIKTRQSRGIIMFRDITLNFVVHRPDVIFDESNPDFDNWSTLITPGSMHSLQYGWSSNTQNDILNGNGLQDKDNQVEGTRTMLFTVTTYSFSINSDGSININVNAQENGDAVLSRLTLSDEQYYGAVSDDSKNIAINNTIREQHTDTAGAGGVPTGQSLVQKLQQEFNALKRAKRGKHGYTIQFKDILNSLCAPTMEAAFKRAGYKKMRFKVGKFNKHAGMAAKNFGGNMSGKDIWDFEFPVSMLNAYLANLKKDGGQLNIREFLQHFTTQIMNSDSWSHVLTAGDKEKAKQDADAAVASEGRKASRAEIEAQEAKMLNSNIMPDMKMKTTATVEKGDHVLLFFIIDLQSEVVQFDDTDKLNTNAKRDEIKEKLDGHSVPMISFRGGLSYIQDAHFEVQQAPLMQSIMIHRYFQPTSRSEHTDISHALNMASRGIDPRKLIFSSAITGDITMLGNFVFDTFALVWLDFGVPRWDGTFYVMGKEDVISRGEFTSTFHFQSAGDDPLGTQGRLTDQQVTAANAALKGKKNG